MRKYITVFVLCFTFFLPSMHVMAIGKVDRDSIIKDDHSFADPDKAVTKHLNLTLKVDFDSQQITGRASWTIENRNNSKEIVFDNRGLNIQKVTIGENETTATYFLDKPHPLLGSALHVQILPETKKVTVYYTTAKDAIALQWLTPEQTTDKKKPYLFTQSYSIWARSWIPCQDMPGIRFTYTATVTVPKGLLAAMSAEGTRRKEATGVYHFKQANPIPSYLMALAVGDMQFTAIDRRTGIYAEPSLVKKAKWEFADMGKMVTTAESLYGKYRWQRFDVLIAPPSFTLSGMENPNLVFLTPGLLAGDRSLVSVVAHELSHSWSGNLVTNATWNDFWLNEGVTTYFEHRIGEVLYGKDEADMQAVISRLKLKYGVAALGDTSKDTHLKLNLSGRNPDDALTSIPYDKGYAFLQTIEQVAGRRRFDAFLRKYFDKHAFQSHTTEQFLKAINTELFEGDTSLIAKVSETEWVYSGGIPANIPMVTAAKFNAIDTLIVHFRDTGKMAELNKKIVSFNEQAYFLNHLPANLTNTEMAILDSGFHFTNTGNYGLLGAWLRLSIMHHYKEAYPQLEKYMFTYGNASYGLYNQLIKTPEGKDLAKKIFQKARSSYHPLTAAKIEDLLK